MPVARAGLLQPMAEIRRNVPDPDGKISCSREC